MYMYVGENSNNLDITWLHNAPHFTCILLIADSTTLSYFPCILCRIIAPPLMFLFTYHIVRIVIHMKVCIVRARFVKPF